MHLFDRMDYLTHALPHFVITCNHDAVYLPSEADPVTAALGTVRGRQLGDTHVLHELTC